MKDRYVNKQKEEREGEGRSTWDSEYRDMWRVCAYRGTLTVLER